MSSNASEQLVREIVIQASAERIFAALVDPEQRVKWWGVAGKFETQQMESDLRPGGAWRMRGVGPGGLPFELHGDYRNIDRPRLLEFTWVHESQETTLLTVVRFELEEKLGATTVRLTHSGLTPQARDYYQGWPWILSLLQTYVEKQNVSGTGD